MVQRNVTTSGAHLANALVTPTGATTDVTLANVAQLAAAGVRSVANMAALLTTTPQGDEAVVWLSGYSGQHDGGEGIFHWDPDSEVAGNGGTVVAPDPGVAGRWLRAPETGPINVKWFGATGNGASDDTVAFQNAVAAVPASGSLYVPDGIYAISDSIDLKSDFEMYGQSHNATLKATTDIVLDDTTEQYRNFIIRTGVNHGITIRNLKFDLTAGGNADFCGGIGALQSYNPSEALKYNICVSDCDFVGGRLRFFAQRCVNLVLENCSFYGGTARAVNIYFCQDSVVRNNRMRFIGIEEDPNNKGAPLSGGSVINTNALDVVAGTNVRIINNRIWATGGTALSCTEHDGSNGAVYDMDIEGNVIVGAGGTGISCLIKDQTNGKTVNGVRIINNVLIGWNCSPLSDGTGDTGHVGIATGGLSAASGGAKNFIIENNTLTNLAPWEIATFEDDGAGYKIRITGSLNIRKKGNYQHTTFTGNEGVLGSSGIGFAGSTTYPAKNVTIRNNTVRFAPQSGIEVKSVIGRIIVSGNSCDNGGWSKANDLRAGVSIAYCVSASVIDNHIFDWAPGMSTIDTLNTAHIRVDESIRTFLNGNTFGTFGANDDTNNIYVKRHAVICKGDGNSTRFGYNEPYSLTLGVSHINGNGYGDAGHSWVVRPVTFGHRHKIAVQGWRLDNLVTASKTVYPWQTIIRKTSTSAITETLWYAADGPNVEIVFINGGASGDVTVAVQTGEKLNGTLNGTDTVVPGAIKRFISNGVDGWQVW